jgi:hypothetical protein
VDNFLKMIRIYACSVAAKMIKFHSEPNWALDMIFKDDAMSKSHLAAITSDVCIALLGQPACINPAFVK